MGLIQTLLRGQQWPWLHFHFLTSNGYFVYSLTSSGTGFLEKNKKYYSSRLPASNCAVTDKLKEKHGNNIT